MLQDSQVPVAIPAKLAALAATTNSKGNAVDGPQALVIKRNEIIHRRSAAPVLKNYEPMIQAWQLGAWYCELAVLRICGFAGLYRNRLSDNIWTGAVEPVPWR